MNSETKLSRRNLLGLGTIREGSEQDDDAARIAVVGTNCLATNNISCRTCEDHCEVRAIRFRPTLGKCEQPIFSSEICTGCGECIAVCPMNAISLVNSDLE